MPERPESQKFKMVGYTSMALNPSNSSNLEQLALKMLTVSNCLTVGVGINVWHGVFV